MPNNPEAEQLGRATGDMSLKDAVDAIGANRKYIWLAMLLFGLAGAIYAWLTPPKYRAQVVMVPAQTKDQASGLLGQFGGLASLAGLNINLSESTTRLAQAHLLSAEFARAFIADLKIQPQLLAARRSLAPWRDTDDERDAVEHFDRKVRFMTEDKKAGTIILTLEWQDPQVAAAWANQFVARLNDHMRKLALDEANRNVAYLRTELGGNTPAPLQQSISRLLESEMQKLMVAKGTPQFAFKVVDPAFPPKRKSSPSRALIVLVASLAGGGLMIAFTLFVASVRRFAIR